MPYLPDPVSSTFGEVEDVRLPSGKSIIQESDQKVDMARFIYLMAKSRGFPSEIRKAEKRLHNAIAENVRHHGGRNEDVLVLQQKIYMGLAGEERRKLISGVGLAFLAYLLTKWCV